MRKLFMFCLLATAAILLSGQIVSAKDSAIKWSDEVLASIQWPDQYLPGTTDCYVSNQTVVKGVPVANVWKALLDPLLYPKFYKDIKEASFVDKSQKVLGPDSKFLLRFDLGGKIVTIHCEIIEFVAPEQGKVGRITWHGLINGDNGPLLNFVQAFLVESLAGDRTRLSSGLSLIGIPGKEACEAEPNPLLVGRQQWIDSIMAWAKKNS